MASPGLVVAALTCAALTALGEEVICSTEHAVRAEVALNALRSWDEAMNYFKQHETCLDGGVSEGYTVFLANKLAEVGGVNTFWSATQKQHWFRLVIATRMQSEVVPLQTTESILENLRIRCPPGADAFCQDLLKLIEQSCPACNLTK